MKQYKHYSFDFWQTLFKSNPAFKEERAQYFHDHFNPDKKTVQEIKKIFSEIDIMCNMVNEKVGSNIDGLEMYAMVLYRLNYDMALLQFRDLHAIYHMMNQIFEKNLPMPFDNDTISVLKELKNRGCTLSILSNTGFVKGVSLKIALTTLGMDRLFDFQIYSDEVGMSKPNEILFRHVLNAIHARRIHNPITDHEIVHVGDNLQADIEGARKVGIDAILINRTIPTQTIKDILF